MYLSLGQLFSPKSYTKCKNTIDIFLSRAEKIFAAWGLRNISMNFFYCMNHMQKARVIFRSKITEGSAKKNWSDQLD